MLVLLTCCTKEIENEVQEKERESFLTGTVNGRAFEPQGLFLVCNSMQAFYYTDTTSWAMTPVGFMFHVQNCETNEDLYIKKKINLSTGNFTECCEEWGNYEHEDGEAILAYPGLPEGACCIYKNDTLDADKCVDIDLEIVEVYQTLEEDFLYIEGYLNALVADTLTGDTVEISNVHFGVKYD